jgi:hypothetical protein
VTADLRIDLHRKKEGAGVAAFSDENELSSTGGFLHYIASYLT